MDFNTLSEFVELANTLSFTATARAMHLSQSTLSRHISDLENELKARLFERGATSVKLTPAGKAFYKRAEFWVRGYHSALGEVRDVAMHEVASLHVCGSTIEPATCRFVSLMTQRAAHDCLPVSYSYTNTRSLDNSAEVQPALDCLRNGNADLLVEVVAPDSPAFEEFDAVPLFREPLAVVASADNPLAHKQHVTFDDLRSCTLVAFEVYKTCFGVLTAPFTAAGYDPGDIESVIIDDFLEFGRLIGALSAFEVMPIEEGLCDAQGFAVDAQGGAVRLAVDDERLAVTYYALFRKDDARPEVSQTRQLVETLLRERKERCAPELLASDGMLTAAAFRMPLPAQGCPAACAPCEKDVCAAEKVLMLA